MSDMKQYVRKPFVVEAMLITEENLDEVAALIGTVEEGSNGRYIRVDKKKLPNVYHVHPGYFLTKMDDKIRCYSPKIFNEQFAALSSDLAPWLNHFAGK